MHQPEEQIILNEARILYCDWDHTGGRLEYAISHLHPDWQQLVQTYRVDSQDYDGNLIYYSEFRLYKYGEDAASNFTDYPKALKVELWKIIFAVKRKFFEEVKPAVVEHFIKQDHSVTQRADLYTKYLSFPNYDIIVSDFDIVYFRVFDEGEEVPIIS